MGIHLVQQGALTVIDDDDDEKESLFALLKSLDGWYVWLAFYLQKPYSALEFDIAPVATARYDVMFGRKSKEQRWAICVLDAYTFFLKNLLKKKKSTLPLNINTIKVCVCVLFIICVCGLGGDIRVCVRFFFCVQFLLFIFSLSFSMLNTQTIYYIGFTKITPYVKRK